MLWHNRRMVSGTWRCCRAIKVTITTAKPHPTAPRQLTPHRRPAPRRPRRPCHPRPHIPHPTDPSCGTPHPHPSRCLGSLQSPHPPNPGLHRRMPPLVCPSRDVGCRCRANGIVAVRTVGVWNSVGLVAMQCVAEEVPVPGEASEMARKGGCGVNRCQWTVILLRSTTSITISIDIR